jgi:hypothetical protein
MYASAPGSSFPNSGRPHNPNLLPKSTPPVRLHRDLERLPSNDNQQNQRLTSLFRTGHESLTGGPQRVLSRSARANGQGRFFIHFQPLAQDA